MFTGGMTLGDQSPVVGAIRCVSDNVRGAFKIKKVQVKRNVGRI